VNGPWSSTRKRINITTATEYNYDTSRPLAHGLETAMLNSKALSDLLTANTDSRLCKRWYLFTPNGTLLAYSSTTDIKDLRRQAARAVLLWQEQLQSQRSSPESSYNSHHTAPTTDTLRTLTIESEEGNTIIRFLQPKLLLVLEGGVPPRRRTFEPRVTAEGPEDAAYPTDGTQQPNSALASSVSSAAESTKSSAPNGVLGLQRRKLDALAAVIGDNFEQTGFRMPEEGNAKVF
jgi:hypothetical protein